MSLYSQLQFFCRTLKPQSYLEIGVREGGSLEEVLKVIQPKRIALCDNWQGEYGGTARLNHNHILPILERFKVPLETVEFYDGDSHVTVAKVPPPQFDLITVDGDHSAHGAWQDLQDSWQLLRPEGILLMDDIYHPAHPYLHDLVLRFALEKEDCWVRIDHRDVRDFGCAVLFKKSFSV